MISVAFSLLVISHRPSVPMIRTSLLVTSFFIRLYTRTWMNNERLNTSIPNKIGKLVIIGNGHTSGWQDRNGLISTSLFWALRSWSPNPRVTPIVANTRLWNNDKGRLVWEVWTFFTREHVRKSNSPFCLRHARVGISDLLAWRSYKTCKKK